MKFQGFEYFPDLVGRFIFSDCQHVPDQTCFRCKNVHDFQHAYAAAGNFPSEVIMCPVLVSKIVGSMPLCVPSHIAVFAYYCANKSMLDICFAPKRDENGVVDPEWEEGTQPTRQAVMDLRAAKQEEWNRTPHDLLEYVQIIESQILDLMEVMLPDDMDYVDLRARGISTNIVPWPNKGRCAMEDPEKQHQQCVMFNTKQ